MSKLVIRVKSGKSISINKGVLHALGNPEHIIFLWSKSEKTLLIACSPEQTPSSYKINKRIYITKDGLFIENSKLLQTILKAVGWHGDRIYRVTGEHIPEMNAVAFRLGDAEELSLCTLSE